MVAFLRAVVFISFIASLAGGLLATAKPEWRVLELGDRSAEKLTALTRRIALLIAAGRVVEAINRAIVAGLGLSVLSKSIFALLVAAALAVGLNSLKPEDRSDAAAERRPIWIVFARLFGWVMTVGIVVSALFGYPVCTVCGQSVSPLSSDRQRDQFVLWTEQLSDQHGQQLRGDQSGRRGSSLDLRCVFQQHGFDYLRWHDLDVCAC